MRSDHPFVERELAPWTRRRFVAAGLAGLLGLALPLGAAARGPGRGRGSRAALRLGLLERGTKDAGSVRAGVELGVAEACRAADLLGEGIELNRARVEDGRAAEAARELLERSPRLHALIGHEEDGGAAAAAGAAETLYLNLYADPASLGAPGEAPTTFHLAPSVEDRVRALVTVLAPRGIDAWQVASTQTAAGARLQERVEIAALDAGGQLGEGALLLALRGADRSRFLERAEIISLPVADAVGEEPFPAANAAPRFRASGWDPAGQAFGAGELNERFRRATGHPMHSGAWLGWSAVKALWETWLRIEDKSSIGLARAMVAGPGFDGHKGVALTFGPDRRLRQPLSVFEVTHDGPRFLGEWRPDRR